MQQNYTLTKQDLIKGRNKTCPIKYENSVKHKRRNESLIQSYATAGVIIKITVTNYYQAKLAI